MALRRVSDMDPRIESIFAVLSIILSIVWYVGGFIYCFLLVDFSPVKIFGFNIPWFLFCFIIVPIVLHLTYNIIAAINTLIFMLIDKVFGRHIYYDDDDPWFPRH